ncbi:hypothetical protein [Sphaerothrix gracilis]|uniref:hypothetical protein n=1 Tax=Sphaerothrix gracilis TaxID=3151835 RepID=UPI0031FDD241
MEPFVRYIQIAKSLEPVLGLSEVTLYSPGTQDALDLPPGLNWLGEIERLGVSHKIRGLQPISLVLVDDIGTRYTLAKDIRLLADPTYIDLLNELFNGSNLVLTEGYQLKLVLQRPETFTGDQHVTVTGYVKESSYQVPIGQTLEVSQGGTGKTSLLTNSILVGNGISPIKYLSPSEDNKILVSQAGVWALSDLPAGGGAIESDVDPGVANEPEWIEIDAQGNYVNHWVSDPTDTFWMSKQVFITSGESPALNQDRAIDVVSTISSTAIYLDELIIVGDALGQSFDTANHWSLEIYLRYDDDFLTVSTDNKILPAGTGFYRVKFSKKMLVTPERRRKLRFYLRKVGSAANMGLVTCFAKFREVR